VSTKANTRTGSICQRLYQVLVLGPDRKIKTMDAATYDRRSAADHGPGCIIEASFQLAEAPPADIRREMERYLERRRTTQPLDWPSAGCIFRNPAEQPAGRLIDQCGCKGMRIGGALVSELHANYIINTGGARSQDVLELIERVRERVYSQTGVTLELEVNVVTAMG
jgi:UDP-N-acetylmuramate dehydrogenase